MLTYTTKFQTQLLLFLVSLIFFISITGGNFWESDSQTVYYLTKSITDQGQISIPCLWEAGEFQGKCYSKYGLFSSISVIPLYLLEKLFREFFHNSYFFAGFFSSLTNCFISSLLVVLIYQYLIKMEFSKKTSALISLLFGFCTYLPVYTKTLFAEPLITLLTYSSIYLLIFRAPKLSNFFWAGILIGLAFLTKFSLIIFLPVFFLLFLFKKPTIKQLFYFSFPTVISIIIFFCYNYIRFNNILDTGYRNMSLDHPLIYGLYLQVLSPGKSLFLYQPFIIFFIFGIKSFYNRQKVLSLLLAIFVAISLIFYSIFTSPTGDLTWGSRYLYPTLPFYIFCVAYFIKYNKNKTLLKIFFVAIILSFIIQASAIFLSYHRYDSYLSKKIGVNYLQKSYNNIHLSPLFGQWKMIFNLGYNNIDDQAWREAFQEHINFNTKYIIAPTDMFFLRSKKELVVLTLFFVLELVLIKKLNNQLTRKNI